MSDPIVETIEDIHELTSRTEAITPFTADPTVNGNAAIFDIKMNLGAFEFAENNTETRWKSCCITTRK